MIKKAYSVQMTYKVSDEEKKQAEIALFSFNHCSKHLKTCADYLNIMKTPFKDNPEIPPEKIMSKRAAIRRFRDEAIENFNKFKEMAFHCVKVMKQFSSDTEILKLMKSFVSTVSDLETKVNKFADLFDDLESKEFSKDIVKLIEGIQEKSDNVNEIIDDRIKDHIQKNILANSWVDSISNVLQVKIDKKEPLILELFNKRQDQLNQKIKNKNNGND